MESARVEPIGLHRVFCKLVKNNKPLSYIWGIKSAMVQSLQDMMTTFLWRHDSRECQFEKCVQNNVAKWTLPWIVYYL